MVNDSVRIQIKYYFLRRNALYAKPLNIVELFLCLEILYVGVDKLLHHIRIYTRIIIMDRRDWTNDKSTYDGIKSNASFVVLLKG